MAKKRLEEKITSRLRTPREKAVFKTMSEAYLEGNGYGSCLACQVMDFWDIPDDSENYPVYEKKQRSILGAVKNYLAKIKPSSVPAFSNYPDKNRLWLMSVGKCKIHTGAGEYRIVLAKADWIEVQTKSEGTVESRVVAHNHRFEDMVRLYPETKRQIRTVSMDVKLLRSK